MEGLDLGVIQLHALGSENSAIEGNLGLPKEALSTVEDNAVFLGNLHQAQEVPVMLLGATAEDTYIIMNGNNAKYVVCCLVYSYLKDILGHFQTEWHTQKTVPAMMCIKSGQV